MSGERVHQLEKKALRHCRDLRRLGLLESSLKDFAEKVLGKENRPFHEDPSRQKNYTLRGEDCLSTPGENLFGLTIRNTENMGPHIALRPLDSNQDGEIVLTQCAAKKLLADLAGAMETLGWRTSGKTLNIAEIKKQYPRAYEKWKTEEDMKLKEGFEQGMPVEKLSTLLKRQPGAVKSRLEKLGLELSRTEDLGDRI